MADYVKNKSFDDEYFKRLIVEYITKQGKTSRKAIDKLIIPKLSAALTEEQKKRKVGNFLSALRMQGIIQSSPGYFWEII
jgi:ATP-dependent DNA helicase RecG